MINRTRMWLLIAFAFLWSFSAPAFSQERPPDFQLGAPRYFLGGHAGFIFPRAGSDLFGLVTRELTLEKSDFRSPAFGFDFGVTFRSRFAMVLAMEYARSSANSESRDFVDENGQAIVQKTVFTQMPVNATLRFYPRAIGETVGTYAWIPNRVLPYIGGGGGIARYTFSQAGDFVDTTTLAIFTATLSSDGIAPTGHLVAGTDIGITKRMFAGFEARYTWGHTDLSGPFKGFQPIDLAGLRIRGGIYFRF